MTFSKAMESKDPEKLQAYIKDVLRDGSDADETVRQTYLPQAMEYRSKLRWQQLESEYRHAVCKQWWTIEKADEQPTRPICYIHSPLRPTYWSLPKALTTKKLHSLREFLAQHETDPPLRVEVAKYDPHRPWATGGKKKSQHGKRVEKVKQLLDDILWRRAVGQGPTALRRYLHEGESRSWRKRTEREVKEEHDRQLYERAISTSGWRSLNEFIHLSFGQSRKGDALYHACFRRLNNLLPHLHKQLLASTNLEHFDGRKLTNLLMNCASHKAVATLVKTRTVKKSLAKNLTLNIKFLANQSRFIKPLFDKKPLSDAILEELLDIPFNSLYPPLRTQLQRILQTHATVPRAAVVLGQTHLAISQSRLQAELLVGCPMKGRAEHLSKLSELIPSHMNRCGVGKQATGLKGQLFRTFGFTKTKPPVALNKATRPNAASRELPQFCSRYCDVVPSAASVYLAEVPGFVKTTLRSIARSGQTHVSLSLDEDSLQQLLKPISVSPGNVTKIRPFLTRPPPINVAIKSIGTPLHRQKVQLEWKANTRYNEVLSGVLSPLIKREVVRVNQALARHRNRVRRIKSSSRKPSKILAQFEKLITPTLKVKGSDKTKKVETYFERLRRERQFTPLPPIKLLRKICRDVDPKWTTANDKLNMVDCRSLSVLLAQKSLAYIPERQHLESIKERICDVLGVETGLPKHTGSTCAPILKIRQKIDEQVKKFDKEAIELTDAVNRRHENIFVRQERLRDEQLRIQNRLTCLQCRAQYEECRTMWEAHCTHSACDPGDWSTVRAFIAQCAHEFRLCTNDCTH